MKKWIEIGILIVFLILLILFPKQILNTGWSIIMKIVDWIMKVLLFIGNRMNK